jgi:hypothetical protein
MVKFGAVEPSNKLMMNLLSGFAGGGGLPLDVGITITRSEVVSQYSYIYRTNRFNELKGRRELQGQYLSRKCHKLLIL